MNQSATQPRCLHGDENQTDKPLIGRPLGSPSCYGAVSVFCHDSNICRACRCFDECDDECLVTLEKIKGMVDVSDLFKRHEAGRKAKGLSITVPPLATPAIALTEQPAETDYDRELEAFLAEIGAEKESLAIQKRGGPTVTSKVILTSAADLDDVDLMHEAKDVITKAKGTIPTGPTESTNLIAEPLNSITCASIEAETASIAPVAPAVRSQPSTATEEETAEDVVADYYFPACTLEDDSHTDHVQLMEELESLVDQVRKPDDYMVIRDRYCEVAVALNRRSLWAPAFRPGASIPFKLSERKPVHTLILRDRIVVDCHWLHSREYKIRLDEIQWRPLFKPNAPFPFELASEFAKREMKDEYRAEGVLGLTIRQQLQMRALRGNSVQKHVHALKQQPRIDGIRTPPVRETIKLLVHRWCEKYPRYESERGKYLAHAEARALLAIVSTSPTEIAELAGMIQGVTPLSEGTVRGLLRNIDKWLAKSAP